MTVTEALEIIGVQSLADFDEIRAAYRQLVKQWHPDRHVDKAIKLDAEVQLRNINAAFSFLEQHFYTGSSTDNRASGSDFQTGDVFHERADNDQETQQASPVQKNDNAVGAQSHSFVGAFWLVILAVGLLSGLLKMIPGSKTTSINRFGSYSFGQSGSSESISGQWRTGTGDLVRLSESGSTVHIVLLTSTAMSGGTGNLTRQGASLSGTLSGTFRNDRSGQKTSPFRGTILNGNRIDYTVDKITFFEYGRETFRSAVSGYMIKVE